MASLADLSVRTKLLAIGLATMIAVTAASLVFTSGAFREEYHSALEDQAHTAAKSLKLQLDHLMALGLSLDNLLGFEEQCQEIVSLFDNVSYAMVTLPDGTVLFHSDTARQGGKTAPVDMPAEDASSVFKVARVDDKGEGYLEGRLPIVQFGARNRAVIKVGLSLRLLESKNREIIYKSLVAIIVISVIGMAVFWAAISYWVSAPLGEFLAHIRKFGGREISFDQRVPVTHKDEIGEISTAFNHMLERLGAFANDLRSERDRANAANLAKSQFLATMSHEFRTPLNAIMGFSEITRQQMFGAVGSEKYLDYAGYIHESAQLLLGLVNNVLDMSKVEAGKYELVREEHSLVPIVDQAVQLVSGRAAEAEVSLINIVPPGLPWVRVDRQAIVQVLLNLLTNAIKFTPEQGTVTISAERIGDFIAVYVSDTGTGIPKEEMDRLFQPFEQIERERNQRFHEGVGLGLSLSKSLVELHGGSISAESELGRGTTMMFRLPLTETAAPEN